MIILTLVNFSCLNLLDYHNIRYFFIKAPHSRFLYQLRGASLFYIYFFISTTFSIRQLRERHIFSHFIDIPLTISFNILGGDYMFILYCSLIGLAASGLIILYPIRLITSVLPVSCAACWG